MALTTGNIKKRFFATAILYATSGFIFCVISHLSDKISLKLCSKTLMYFFFKK